MKPILKINLDELTPKQLNHLSSFLMGMGKTKLSLKIEQYIVAHGFKGPGSNLTQ